MSALRNIRLLTRYSAWANSLLYSSIGELPNEELTKPRQSVFGNLIRILNHVYTMDLVWQAHLEGRSHGFTARTPEVQVSFSELRMAQATLDSWYVRYAEEMSDRLGEEIVEFTFIGNGEGAMTRGDILLHVVNHTTYHRGHISAMMHQIPARPPTTDLPVFLRNAALQTERGPRGPI
ncbi:MAG TPA: DinB family protein [Steroidobacteraceae bacterium]|jgi:uncharacterized damage-inducible protein DinB|nr:DinB family protein [Steroidobacteraceae bacterium]